MIIISTNKFEEGIYVAVLHNDWSDEPVIGRIIGQSIKELEVRWYDGTYHRKWKPSRKRHNGEYIPWIDTVLKSSILLQFKVLASAEEFKLQRNIVDILKVKYAEARK